ncbi:unnamed protein product [Closterium sp. Naga37s-1]|nr:unnamed protein product [Closterium sp. Naga37s-1]
MVIAGASEPSPERVAAWSAVAARSAVAAKPPSGPERATMATKPPVPPAQKPVTEVSEKTLPHAPADPLAVPDAGPSAPVAVPSALAAGPGPLAPLAEPPASAPAVGVTDPPVPVPGAPFAPPASIPDVPAPASASSPKAASATTGGSAPSVAPSAAGQSVPAVTPMAQAGAQVVSSQQQQSHWPAHPGGQGDWRGPRGHGGGGGYRPPVTMADLQREVSRAVREERAVQSQSSSLRPSPALEAPRQPVLPVSPPPLAAPPPQVHRPTAPAPAASAPAPGSRLHLPPVPPVAGVEFVSAGGGAAATQYSHHAAANEPLMFLAEALQPPQTRVPEATLGQLHRLAEILHALLLIQVVAHSSLPVIPPETFRDRPCETCLDAADQLAVLLAPVLAEPAEGCAAAAGQLDEAYCSALVLPSSTALCVCLTSHPSTPSASPSSPPQLLSADHSPLCATPSLPLFSLVVFTPLSPSLCLCSLPPRTLLNSSRS